MQIISTQRLGMPEGSCRYCDVRAYDSFNWSAARWPWHRDLRAIRVHLRKETALKWGTLLRCVECPQAWYLDGGAATATRVRTTEEPLLRRWNATSSMPTPAAVEALQQIRGTGPDMYGNSGGHLKFPCSIRWPDGGVSDPAVLVVTKHPPLEYIFGPVRLFDPRATIGVSPFALPLEVRVETRRARELAMGFAPTAVEDTSGGMFLLNGSLDVFDHAGTKGEDMRLSARGWNIDALPPIVPAPGRRVTVAVADWWPEAQRLTAGP